jgi:next-to-BRCA1 protein 1
MPTVLKVKFQEDTRRTTLEKPPTYAELLAILTDLFPNLLVLFSVKYLDEDEDLVTISSDMELAEAFRIASATNVLRLFITPKMAQPATPTRSTNTEPSVGLPNVNDFAAQLLQMFGGLNQQPAQKPQANISDLASLFQNLGLDTNSSSTQPNQSTQPQPPQVEQFIQQLLTNPAIQQLIPHLLPLLTQLFPLISSFTQAPSSQPDNYGPVVHYGVICDWCDGTIQGIRYKCLNCDNYDLCERCKVIPDVHDSTHSFNTIAQPLPRSVGRGCPYRRGSQNNNNSWTHHARHRKTAQQNGFLARFVSDVTVPDGIAMAPGQQFVKIWRLRNEGNIAWAEGTCLEHVGGDKLAVSDAVPVPVTSPGEEIDIAVDMTAPLKPGRYVSFWKLCHVDGSRFGQRVWVDIRVGSVEETSVPSVAQTQSTQTSVTNSMDIETQTTQPSSINKATETTGTSITVGTNTLADVVVPSPITVVSPEVQQLLDMGFHNPAHLQQLLDQNNNDMVKTVQQLL